MNPHFLRPASTILFLFAFLTGAAEPEKPSLSDFDALVGRWVELRSTLAAEKQSWEEDEQRWNEEIALLETEKAALLNEIETSSAFSATEDKKRMDLLTQKEKLDRELNSLRGVLDRAEASLRTWEPFLPEQLREQTAPLFQALPQNETDAPHHSIVKRAQNVVALFTRIETLQNNVHATRETLDVAGQRRQVEVLYLGLACGFAVSANNDWAASGLPAAEGWRWTPGGVDPLAVRTALDVLNRQRTATLVELPLHVQPEVAR